MNVSFTHLWQQQEFSDVEVLLTAPADLQQQQQQQLLLLQDGQEGQRQTDQQQIAQPHRLASFPGHSAILSNSPFIKAQILRWQHKRPREQQQAPGDQAGDEPAGRSAGSRAKDSSSNDTPKPQLVLTLQDESEQQAAMAVLAALYLAKPLPELLSELTQEQQLQAALLADMWQVSDFSTAAAANLMLIVQVRGALSLAGARQLLTMQAVPDCLQPLLKRVLLSKFGDLEAAWADAKLRKELMLLPLPAMEALLSCDELQVASEDTVLYTARMYCKRAKDERSPSQIQAIQQRLVPVIRCQHLSPFWLVVLDDALLASLQPQLHQLLLLQTVQPGILSMTKARLSLKQLHSILPGAPSSWTLGRRVPRPVGPVQLHWRVEVSAIKEALQRCAAEQATVLLQSPTVTPPVGGIDFGVLWTCTWNADLGGCRLSLRVGSRNVPKTVLYAFACKLDVAGVEVPLPGNGSEHPLAGLVPAGRARGRADAFGLGAVAEGWNEAAWAAKGLPTSGQLDVRLTVTNVGHASTAIVSKE